MGELLLKINKKTLAVKIEGEDFVGGECLTEADALQQALGLETTSESPKDEMVYHVGQSEIGQGQG